MVRAKTEKSEADIERERMKIIRQAAPVVVHEADPKNEWSNFCLRIKKSMSKEIESIVEESVGLNKTAFILQAINEKIKRHKEGC